MSSIGVGPGLSHKAKRFRRLGIWPGPTRSRRGHVQSSDPHLQSTLITQHTIPFLAHPPTVGTELPLHGTVVLYSLDPAVAAFSWRLEAQSVRMPAPQLLGQGQGSVDNGPLGTWTGADPTAAYELRTVITDGLRRDLIARLTVPGLHIPRRHLPRGP